MVLPYNETTDPFETYKMAEHILMAQAVTCPEDMKVVETVIKLLLKDEHGGNFVSSAEFIAAKTDILNGEPTWKSFSMNDIRISVRPCSGNKPTTCTVCISRIYPNLKPAGVVKMVPKTAIAANQS